MQFENTSNGQQQEHDANSVESGNAKSRSEVSWKTKMARLYYFLFLMRRLIKVLILVLIPNSLFSLRVILFLIIQVAHMMYLIKIRSFAEYANQIIEVLNESVLFILAIFLIDRSSESEWTDAAVNVFIGIILSHL